MHVFEGERFFVQLGRVARAAEFPRSDVRKRIVVALGFAFFSLMLFTEVAARRLFAGEGIDTGELRELEEIRNSAGFFEHPVELLTAADDAQVAIELFAQLRDL